MKLFSVGSCALLTLITAFLFSPRASRAQSAESSPKPAPAWPSLTKPAPADYDLSRDEFLARYGVNDSAVAIIKMFYAQRRRGKQLANQPVNRMTRNVHENYAVVADVGRQEVRFWSPGQLYVTLYRFHTMRELPSHVMERLPVYLERVQSLNQFRQAQADSLNR